MSGFPFFKQLDFLDCGPSCLRMIAKNYGKSYSIQSLRNKAYITKSGVSMLGISEAAESIGFRTPAGTVSPGNSYETKSRFPALFTGTRGTLWACTRLRSRGRGAGGLEYRN